MPPKKYPGELEQMILLAILRRGEGAHALSVIRELEESVGRPISRGSLYKTLDRMEAKGLVSWTTEEDVPERGGHPRRQFTVTDEGLLMLQASREALLRLWDGVEPALEGGSR